MSWDTWSVRLNSITWFLLQRRWRLFWILNITLRKRREQYFIWKSLLIQRSSVQKLTNIAILHFGRSCHIFQAVLCGQNNSAYQLSTEKVHTLKDMVSTNVYSEEFFRIKKHISFSGKPRYTIDPFFEDNYKDYASILKKVMVDTLIFDGNFFLMYK